jgi:hypothetical protein
MTSTVLTHEEELVYEFAIHWREADYCPDLSGIDWLRFADLLCKNRMGVLARQVLTRTETRIPPAAQKIFDMQIEKYEQAASLFEGPLQTYLASASKHNLDTLVLKGLWLCEKIYQYPSMRPGSDIDILVRRDQVQACMALLKEQGIGEYWPNLLNDEYFTRHHLHQQRSSPDLRIWFEIHWALDHPYTLLTVDYAGIFERARPAQLLGAPALEMSLPDLLLSLAIHLVKHAVYLPSLIERDDLPRITLAEGWLMYYLDLTEVIKQFNSNIDWDLTVQLARSWGAVEILGAVLRVCSRYLKAPVPEGALTALPITTPLALTRKLMARAVEQELAAYQNLPVNRFWGLLLSPNGAFILRPIRLLETGLYFLPPAEYLNRRYGRADLGTRLRHLLRAVGQMLRFSWDSLYFGLERYIRLKRMGKNASLFNTLDTDL